MAVKVHVLACPCPLSAKATSVQEWCRWGVENTRGSRMGEGVRKREREREGGGGRSEQPCRAVPERNADCFHVWGGQESRVGCRQVRLAPNEKSCVGDGGGPRHCSPVAERSQS